MFPSSLRRQGLLHCEHHSIQAAKGGGATPSLGHNPSPVYQGVTFIFTGLESSLSLITLYGFSASE